MVIAVLSKKDFMDYIPPHSNCVAISIQDPDRSCDLEFGQYDEWIEVWFWDVEKRIGHYKPITNEIAEYIASFIRTYKDEDFVIHCEAGQSRSAGVALAVECIQLYDGDKYAFATGEHTSITSHPRYSPNLTVYDRIIEAYNRIKDKK